MSTEIIVNNCYTRVVSEDKELLLTVYNYFSIHNKNFWYSPLYKRKQWDGKTHFFSKVQQRLPTGLLDELIDCIRKEKRPYKVTDKREDIQYKSPAKTIGKYDLSSIQYDYQYEALCRALANGRGVLELATNAGKTIIAAAIIRSLGLSVLYVCGTKAILLQTEKVFKEVGIPCSVLGAGRNEVGKVTIATSQKLSAVLKARNNKLKNFKVLFFDECHHGSSKTWIKIAMTISARYRFGLSGTPFDKEDQVKNWKLIGATGPLLKKVENIELMKRGVSAVPTVVFTKAQVEKTLPTKDFAKALKQGIERDDKRNKQICNLTRNLLTKNQKVMILTPRKLHAVELYKELTTEQLNGEVFFIHGDVPDDVRDAYLSRFKSDGPSVIIATTVFDEGVDIPEINSLIMAMAGKSSRKVKQRVGRVIRKKQAGKNIATIYDFWDWHNVFLAEHSESRLDTYLREGFKVIAGRNARSWLEDFKRGMGVQTSEEGHRSIPLPQKASEKKPRRSKQTILAALHAIREADE